MGCCQCRINGCNTATTRIILYMHNTSATSLQLLQQFYFKFYSRCNVLLLHVAALHVACFMFYCSCNSRLSHKRTKRTLRAPSWKGAPSMAGLTSKHGTHYARTQIHFGFVCSPENACSGCKYTGFLLSKEIVRARVAWSRAPSRAGPAQPAKSTAIVHDHWPIPPELTPPSPSRTPTPSWPPAV